MKTFFTAALICCAAALPTAVFAEAPPTTVGRIVLDVEDNGQAWYVSPDSKDRFFLPDGSAAYSAMQTLGLGITNVDLDKIPIGILEIHHTYDWDQDGVPTNLEDALDLNRYRVDTDGDGYTDKLEILSHYNPNGEGKMPYDAELVESLKGRILLQVENKGQAWYVSPTDGRRYFMKDGSEAYDIMRLLSLGVSGADLESIPVSETELDCFSSLECFRRAIEENQAVKLSVDGTVYPTDETNVYVSGSVTAKQTAKDENGYHHLSVVVQDMYTWFRDDVLSSFDEFAALENHTELEEELLYYGPSSIPYYEATCSYKDPYNVTSNLDQFLSGTFYYLNIYTLCR